MKFQRNNQNQMNALYLFIVLVASIAFYFLLKNFSLITQNISNLISIISPFLMGFLFAYLLIRPLRFIEKNLERFVFRGKFKSGLKRSISIIILLLLIGAFISIVSAFVIPQLLQSLSTLTNALPGYVRSLERLLNSIMASTNVGENLYQVIAPYWKHILDYLSTFLSQLAPWLINLSMQLASRVLNMFVTLIVIIYFLFNKELFCMQLKKLLYSFLPIKFIKSGESIMKIVDETFGGYINGQLTDAVVVGAITVVLMTIFKLPYALLVGVIVACTNVIPMVGPFIGAVPSTFIILMAGKPIQALGFLVLILAIQQFDGNILVPKIVGDSTGLSGFWVLFAIMVSGGLFGIVGIIFCVPTLSVFFKLLKLWIEYRLEKRELPVNTRSYTKDADITKISNQNTEDESNDSSI